MAYIGGALKLPKEIFYGVFLISLLFVVARIYFWPHTTIRLELSYQQKIIFSILSGSLLGLVAGIVGIGGGIFLVPLILVFGLGTEKEAAACGAIFIWLNSMSGMIEKFRRFDRFYTLNYCRMGWRCRGLIYGFVQIFTPNH